MIFSHFLVWYCSGTLLLVYLFVGQQLGLFGNRHEELSKPTMRSWLEQKTTQEREKYQALWWKSRRPTFIEGQKMTVLTACLFVFAYCIRNCFGGIRIIVFAFFCISNSTMILGSEM